MTVVLFFPLFAASRASARPPEIDLELEAAKATIDNFQKHIRSRGVSLYILGRGFQFRRTSGTPRDVNEVRKGFAQS